MVIVVISGVSKGLGRAMTDGLMAAGCTVAGCSRSKTAIAELQQKYGDKHTFSEVNVASDTEVSEWSHTIIGELGTPDFLINNAALINENAFLWEIAAKEFDALTAVNINGTANMVRHFVPAMIRNSSGVIVNFSSGWGRSVSAKVAPYCASKWAIEGLTRAMAEELPAGMAVVSLNPGVINTDMLQSCFGSGADTYPTAETWAKSAVPFILNLTSRDNGTPLTVH